jgi:adenylosuccinate synthase
VADELLSYADRVRPMVRDVARELNDALDEGKLVVFEGAQAHHLDVDHGTYPYVTSSNPIAAGAMHRLRRRPDAAGPHRRHRQGLHDPRGRGPVPDRAARRGRRPAAQRSAASSAPPPGRPRRCGWFDPLVVEAGRAPTTASPTCS